MIVRNFGNSRRKHTTSLARGTTPKELRGFMSERTLDRLMALLGAAVVGLAIFGAVLALAPSGPDPHAVAADVLAAAQDGIDQAGSSLPEGGAALVTVP